MQFSYIPQKNLFNRPVRTLLTCLGVALGVASFIALLGLSRGVETAWESGMDEKGTHILGMRKGAAEILTATLDEIYADGMRAIAGVQMVSGELLDLVQLDTGPITLVNGWPLGSPMWKTLHIIKGSISETGAEDGLVLGEGLARALDLTVGDTLVIHGEKNIIAAIHQSKGALNNNSLILNLEKMQALTGKDGQVTVFNICIENQEDPSSLSAVMEQLHLSFPDMTFQQTSQIAENNKILALFRAIAWGTSSIALVVCVFVVLNTLLMSVTERRKEIGIYSTLGWQPSRIILMIGIEAIMLTSIGGLIGIVLGIGGLYWLVGVTVLHAYIEPQIDVGMIAGTFLMSLLLGAVSSIYPAWQATRINPSEALRYE